MMKHLKSRNFLALFFTLASATVLSSLALGTQIISDFQNVDAEYQVYYNHSKSKTKNILKIERKHNRYSLDFRVQHMLGSIKQQASFEWRNCQAKPISSYYKMKAIGFSKKEIVTFDHENKIAKVRGSKEIDLPIDEDTSDSVSFFLEARCGIMNGETDFAFPTVNKARLKTIKYKVMGTEQVVTPHGSYEAIKVERVHKNKKRKTHLWIAPALDYMLVQMYHYENSVVSGMIKLKKIDYSLVEPNIAEQIASEPITQEPKKSNIAHASGTQEQLVQEDSELKTINPETVELESTISTTHKKTEQTQATTSMETGPNIRMDTITTPL